MMRVLVVVGAILSLAFAVLLIRPPGGDLDLAAVIESDAELPGWAATLGNRLGRFAPRVETFASGERVVTVPLNTVFQQDLPPDPDHESRIAVLVLREGPDITLRYRCARVNPGDRCPREPDIDPPRLAEGDSVTFDIGPGGGSIVSVGAVAGPTIIALED